MTQQTKVDAVIVVPPFAGIDRASLGAHVLQAVAKDAGFKVQVYYANIRFAALIGNDLYSAIVDSPFSLLVGESLFSKEAFNIDSISYIIDNYDALFSPESPQYNIEKFKAWLPQLKGVEDSVPELIRQVTAELSGVKTNIVGCTSTFQQVTSSVAILNGVKKARSETITLMGGANCDGPMAKGILSLGADIDYVFSGESERAFIDFLDAARKGKLPENRVVEGEPLQQMDELPIVNYQEYYQQFNSFFPTYNREQLPLIYETSRGCWWGQKHHCTFCGFIGTGMAFREKSGGKVIEELRALLADHPNKHVTMTDSIMPHSYFKTLLPEMPEALPGIDVFYEQKANLTLKQLLLLKRAGVSAIQPGIEAMSTELLVKIKKGNKTYQNLNLLKYSRMLGIFVEWIFIYGFPNDKLSDYPIEYLELIRHFFPPVGPIKLSIDRFSPYHKESETFGIENMKALDIYRKIFPETTSFEDIAFYFTGDYQSESLQDGAHLLDFEAGVDAWRKLWANKSSVPVLSLKKISEDRFALLDTRQISGLPELQMIDRAQATVLTNNRKKSHLQQELIEEYTARKLAICVDGWFIPLVVTTPSLLEELSD
jgi:ribosomal peptide maturation radical SAM protein 1